MTNETLTTSEYLKLVLGRDIYSSGTIPLWHDSPEAEKASWDEIDRNSACVFDFVSTSSLLRYLIGTGDLAFHRNSPRQLVRGTYVESDIRLLHQLLFHDRIYLNFTGAAREQIDVSPLEQLGFEEYPRPRVQSFFDVHRTIKPMMLDYLEKLLGPLPDFTNMLDDEVINREAAGPPRKFLSFLFDEVVNERTGNASCSLEVAHILKPQFAGVFYDYVGEVVDGLTPMINDSMSMMTLAPVQKIGVIEPSTHLRDDTFVLLQIALNDELAFTPRVESLQDVMRLRRTSELKYVRELFGELNRSVKRSEESVISEIKKEIIAARRAIKSSNIVNNRYYVWITTALGFVPVIGQLLGIGVILLYEAANMKKKKNNWVYLGLQ